MVEQFMTSMLKRLEKTLEFKYIPFFCIAFFTVLLYANSIFAPFTLDDFSSISNNYAIRNPFDIASIWSFYTNRFILYYTISLNYFIHNTAVEGYHIVNIIIHTINGILLFLLVKDILKLRCFEGRLEGKYGNLVSTVISMLFISHPVQVNAVTYIIQRTAALAATFYLMSMLFYVRYRVTNRLGYFGLTLLSIVLAMFTKENTITIPFMLLFLELLFFTEKGDTPWKKRLMILIALFITLPIIPCINIFHTYIGAYNQSDPGTSFKASTSMDRYQYFFTELNVIILYIKLLFIPSNLNFDYGSDFPVSHSIWEKDSLISLIILVAIFLYGAFNFRRNRLIAFGICWFFVGLSIESSFFSIKDVYFEHRLYFPLGGFLTALAGIVLGQLKRRQIYVFRKPILFYTLISCFMLLLFSGLTVKRNYVFSDGIRLWSDVVIKAPGNDRAHSILATNYLDAFEGYETKRDEYLFKAEAEFKKAIELNYSNDTAHCNLSKVYLLRGDYEKCINEANEANRLNESVYAYNNLGLAYKNLGQTENSLQAFNSGYNIDRKCTFILKNLGNTYYEKHDYNNARFYYQEFLRYNIYSDNKEIQKKLDEIEGKM